MKTLYVSDLDGTLLRSDETLSTFTIETLNALTAQGVYLTFATARSFHTARKVTKGIALNAPIIAYNGTMIVNADDGKSIVINSFHEEFEPIIRDLLSHGIYPIVYAINNEQEQFSYIEDCLSPEARQFIRTRKGDKRDHPITHTEAFFAGEIFYITCIDKKEQLMPFFEKYRSAYRCLFYADPYTGHQWLEIMPQTASKSNAIRQLKEYLQCEKVVVFGDGENDREMFKVADEAYAVANAIDELKTSATGVIDSNDRDGVAKWLSDNTNKE